MVVIAKPRAAGKTHDLILVCEAAGPGSFIVCLTYMECEHIAAMARKMDCDINYPVTVQQLQQGYLAGRRVTGLYFDNIERVLPVLLSLQYPVAGLTVNL